MERRNAKPERDGPRSARPDAKSGRSVELAVDGLHGRPDEMLVDTVGERSRIDARGRVDSLERALNILLAVREAHDERGSDHTVANELLEEQCAKRLRWHVIRV